MDRETSINPKCFVIMPQGNGSEYSRGHLEANFIYDKIIKPAVDAALGPNMVVRAIDVTDPGSITKEIITSIFEYEYAIVDITGLNPNVFYELGVRHSLKKNKTIVIKQDNSSAPFDIQGYRYIEYNPFNFERASKSIASTIKSLKEKTHITDSLVFDVLGDYEIILKHNRNFDVVPWTLVYRAVDKIVDRLARAKSGTIQNNEKYQPDLIIGITNGGMLFAEILYRSLRDRRIYQQGDCKLHTLWAERRPHAVFDDPLNEGMLKGLVSSCGKNENEIRILLLDDNSGTANTASIAKDYIIGLYPSIHVRFLPLFYKVSTVYDSLGDLLLWNHKAFLLNRTEVESIHFVEQAEFPYKKHIQDHVSVEGAR